MQWCASHAVDGIHVCFGSDEIANEVEVVAGTGIVERRGARLVAGIKVGAGFDQNFRNGGVGGGVKGALVFDSCRVQWHAVAQKVCGQFGTFGEVERSEEKEEQVDMYEEKELREEEGLSLE